MTCLTIETLCRHIDNELDAHMQASVAAHLGTCQSCRGKLRTFQEHDAMVRGYVPALKPPASKGPGCYSPEELSAYASDQLTPREADRFEQHLYRCDFCLGEVMAIRRTSALLKRGELLAPPDSLVTVAQHTFAGSEQESTVEKLGTLVIQVATDGLKFVEALLLPEDVQLTMSGHAIPAAAFRASQAETEAVALLDIRQTVRDLELHCRALHEDGEKVLLHVRVHKEGEPLVRRRVSLSRNNHTVYSKITSASGEVEFPRLVPGDYTMRIPQEKLEVGFMLRSSGTLHAG
jgi:hypothetical protein